MGGPRYLPERNFSIHELDSARVADWDVAILLSVNQEHWNMGVGNGILRRGAG